MTATISQAARADTLRRFKADPRVSVLVVGGGINGAGTFRDLALKASIALSSKRTTGGPARARHPRA